MQPTTSNWLLEQVPFRVSSHVAPATTRRSGRVLGQIVTGRLHRYFRNDLHADVPQAVRWPNAGKQKKMGAAHRTGAENHLPCGIHRKIGSAPSTENSGGSTVLHRNPSGVDAREDGQVRAIPCRIEVGPRRAPARAPKHRAVQEAETLLHESVYVVGARMAGLLPGLQKRPEKRVVGLGPQYLQRAAIAPIAVATAAVGFHPNEIGKNVGIPPTVAARLPPTVEVECMTTNEHHSVYR